MWTKFVTSLTICRLMISEQEILIMDQKSED